VGGRSGRPDCSAAAPGLPRHSRERIGHTSVGTRASGQCGTTRGVKAPARCVEAIVAWYRTSSTVPGIAAAQLIGVGWGRPVVGGPAGPAAGDQPGNQPGS